jgi:glycosyltransferase involved in cell wall biosynthesis
VRIDCKKEAGLKVILFANTAWYLYNFRLPLALALREQGNEVILLSPGETPYHELLQQNGFRSLSFPLQRRRVNPLAEIESIWQIFQIYRREQPDIVHHFTIKPVLYGSLAAHLLGMKKIINAVSGLGYVFTASDNKGKLLRAAAKKMYQLSLRGTQVVFQNPDDAAYFTQLELVKPGQISLIRGSGVDIHRFQPTQEPQDTPLVILPARMLWDKGIQEFVEAASKLKSRGVPGRFALVGAPDPGNPESVPVENLEKWKREGIVEWWGWRDDMIAVYHSANIVCLPTRYREGTPKTLIEAAACARPIVATNVPGCREVVQDGHNGFLTPPINAEALADALQMLIEKPAERQRMGRNGRVLAVEEFSTDRIISETLRIYHQLGLHQQY